MEDLGIADQALHVRLGEEIGGRSHQQHFGADVARGADHAGEVAMELAQRQPAFVPAAGLLQRELVGLYVERGQAPGGPSRWSTERTGEWQPVAPKIVVEVAYDHFTGGRFRHGTRFLRWRPDKDPYQCTMDQVEHREGNALVLL